MLKSDEKQYMTAGRNSVTFQKSRVFARRIVRLCQWLRNEKNEYTLLYDTDYISEEMYDSMMKDCSEILRLLTSSSRTSREHAESIRNQR